MLSDAMIIYCRSFVILAFCISDLLMLPVWERNGLLTERRGRPVPASERRVPGGAVPAGAGEVDQDYWWWQALGAARTSERCAPSGTKLCVIPRASHKSEAAPWREHRKLHRFRWSPYGLDKACVLSSQSTKVQSCKMRGATPNQPPKHGALLSAIRPFPIGLHGRQRPTGLTCVKSHCLP